LAELARRVEDADDRHDAETLLRDLADDDVRVVAFVATTTASASMPASRRRDVHAVADDEAAGPMLTETASASFRRSR
jgi:hypothetical protein